MANIPSMPLKIVFFIHLLLTTWASQGFWLPNSYIYYNAFFLLIVLWSIHHKESDEPVMMALLLDCLSVLIDIIVVAVYCRSYPDSHEKFTIAMAIINIVMRPISAIILYRVMNERISGIDADFGISGFSGVLGGNAAAGQRGPYEDIDRGVSQSLPQNSYEPFNPRPKGPYPGDDHLTVTD